MKIFTLSKSDVEQLIDIPDIIEVIEEAFSEYNSGNVTLAPIANLSVEDNGEVHIKAGHIHGYANYCVKIAAGFYKNASLGLPSLFGIMLLYDAETGRLVSQFFDQGLLTTVRTAAAGAIAAKHLAQDTISTAGLIGVGTQGKMQMKFLQYVKPFKKLCLWDMNPEFLEQSKNELQIEMPDVEIKILSTASEVTAESDIVVTATPANTPVLFETDLHPGLHITAIGSDDPKKQEIDSSVFRGVDKIIVDRTDQSVMLGELDHAINDGVVSRDDVYGELGELVLGKNVGRESDDEVTLCDLTGMAVQDIAISVWAQHKAHTIKVGRIIEV
jgi:ornithine cyclodeaminase/alanine dehydrogenase-like protein (mu-crystallin family)